MSSYRPLNAEAMKTTSVLKALVRLMIPAAACPFLFVVPATAQGQVVNLVQSPSFEEHGTARIEPVG
jgi:hypothetical protein